MASRKITSKQYFRLLKLIHIFLLSGVVIFACYISYSLSNKELTMNFDPEANIYYIIIGMFGIIAVFGGDIAFKSLVKKAQIQPLLSAKMLQYQSANIIRFALLEVVAL